MNRVYNMVVTRAGYRYVGHFRRGELLIVLEGQGSGITLYPKDEFNFVDLFSVFGIDAEDGVMLNSLKGKHCRVVVDVNGRVKELVHIVCDRIRWEVKE